MIRPLVPKTRNGTAFWRFRPFFSGRLGRKCQPPCTEGASCSEVDVVKDDSGSYAVLPEQGSSASQLTGRYLPDYVDARNKQATQCTPVSKWSTFKHS